MTEAHRIRGRKLTGLWVDEAEGLDVPLKSVAIQRLIDEIRNGDHDMPASYNRTYNRHNRS